ncbi:MAG: MFS transporter [Candidatus Dormibacteria bacterium]
MAAAVFDLLRAIPTRRIDPARRLLVGQLIMFTGIAALFPVVPLYVAAHGGSSLDIGLFIAGPMVANTLVQIPAGRLVDRIGRKPVLVGSRLIYSAVSLLLFADIGPLWLLALFRCGQGVTGGAYVPALRAALADLTPPERRGERYSQLQACEMVGLLVGPAIGGAVALWHTSAIFLAAGSFVLLGTVSILRLPETRTTAGPKNAMPPPPRGWWHSRSLIVPALALAAAGVLFSTYDVIWPQYLSARNQGPFVIGLTISIFAIPILLLSSYGGRLGDRGDRRLLVSASLLVVGICAATYPLLHSLALILSLGIVEAIAFILIEPSLFALISEAAHPDFRGRAMGLGGFFQFAGGGLGAGVLGSLYGLGEAVPFYGAAAVCVLAALMCILLLPGRRRGAPAAVAMAAAVDLEARV